jgi:hypothetical protein
MNATNATNLLKKKQIQMLEALEKTRGHREESCRIVGIHKATHYRWYKENEAYQSAVDNILDVATDSIADLAVNALIEMIKDKNAQAVIYTLKTAGRKRGFGEGQIDEPAPYAKTEFINDIDDE